MDYTRFHPKIPNITEQMHGALANMREMHADIGPNLLTENQQIAYEHNLNTLQKLVDDLEKLTARRAISMQEIYKAQGKQGKACFCNRCGMPVTY